MVNIIDKRARAALFRSRLRAAMDMGHVSQSALARSSGVDRSTISQVLGDAGARLPNAHQVGAFAAVLGVSADWLLGLSDRPESAQALLDNAMSLTDAPRALIDEQVFAWHQEAAGYKIRYVPAALPDMLKTRAMMQWEYGAHLGRTAEQAIHASNDRLDWMRASPSDYEIALPLHEIDSLARGQGYYRDLPCDLRLAQIDRIIELSETLYPRLRLYLFDARRVLSAPMSIYGPLLATLYIGSSFVVFRDSARVRSFSEHFDGLVRAAEIAARDCAKHLTALRGYAQTPQQTAP